MVLLSFANVVTATAERCSSTAGAPAWFSAFSNDTRGHMVQWTCGERDQERAKQPRLEESGFVLVRELLSPEETASLRQRILDAAESGVLLRGQPPFGGHFSPDPFHPRFSAVRPVIEHVLTKPALHAALQKAFRGARYLWTGMSDIQVNRSVHWHRDLARPDFLQQQSSLVVKHWSRDLFTRDAQGTLYHRV